MLLKTLRRFGLLIPSDFKGKLMSAQNMGPKEMLNTVVDISNLRHLDLTTRYGKTLELRNFFESLAKNVSKYDLEIQLEFMRSVCANSNLRDIGYTHGFWPAIATSLTKNMKNISIQDKIEVFHTASILKVTGFEIRALIGSLVRSIEKSSASDLESLSFERSLRLLWCLDHSNIRDPKIYKLVGPLLINHPHISKASVVELSKALCFFGKNEILHKFLNKQQIVATLEKLITDALVSSKDLAMTDLIDVHHFVLLGNTVTAELLALLQNKIIENMKESGRKLNHLQVMRIANSYGKLKIENKVLVKTLIDQAMKCLPNFELKDMALFLLYLSYDKIKNKKSIHEITKFFTNKLKEEANITFSHFGDIIQHLSNAKLINNQLMSLLEERAIRHIKHPEINYFDIVRYMAMLSMAGSENRTLFAIGIDKCLEPNPNKTLRFKDTTRLVITVLEGKQMSTPQVLYDLEGLLFKNVNFIKPCEAAKTLYCCAKFNSGTEEFYKLYSKRLSEKNLGLMNPIAFGRCAFAFGMIEEFQYIRSAMYYANQ